MLKEAKEGKKEKKKYKLLGGSEDPLEFLDKDPAFHYRVFNDSAQKPGRIARAKASGYEAVESETDMGTTGANIPSRIGNAVTIPAGPGVTGVLMRKPKKLWEEQQKEKQKLVDESEEGIRRHANGPNRYGKINIGKMTEDR